jgi:MFS family permease
MKSWYRWYVLGILMVVYAVNALDRVLVASVAPFVKTALAISDAQIGLLYGTAFALFYGVFGIPLAKLADGWSRKRTLSLGLSFWSIMTALSGTASSFVQLGLARIGVGIGEASASPAAVSLLGDYFDKTQRSSIISFYLAGGYVGAGLSLIVGGMVVAAWMHHFPVSVAAPFGLAGWQAAFIGVGLPGLLLAALVHFTIREPVRGVSDGIPQPQIAARPFAAVLAEAASMLPPWSLIDLYRRRSRREFWRNVLCLAILVALVAGVVHFTDSLLSPQHRAIVATLGSFPLTSNSIQWIAVGIAAYAALSWTQQLKARDAVAHCLIAGSPTFVALVLGAGLMGIAQYAVSAFVFLYANRYLGFQPESGLVLGTIAVAASVAGLSAGGVIGNLVTRRNPAWRLIFIMVAFLLFSLAMTAQYTTANTTVFCIFYFVSTFLLTMWQGSLIAAGQDLVLPRLRGVAFAFIMLGNSAIGLGTGPYIVGLVSDVTGNLRLAILCVHFALLPALLCLWFASRRVGGDEASLAQRAKVAGEPVRSFESGVRCPTCGPVIEGHAGG